MLGFVKKHTIAVSLATALVVTATTGTALAVLTTGGGGTITKVNAVSETAATVNAQQVFNNVPGATTTIFVPPGETALITARFTAESQCTGIAANAVGRRCAIRILDNAAEMRPQSGIDAAFDSVSTPFPQQDFQEGHAVERDSVAGPGTHVVRVQRAVSGPNTVFRLDDWHLTVERSQRTAP